MLDQRKLKSALKTMPNPSLTGFFFRAVEEAALNRFNPPLPLYALGPGLSGQRYTPPGGPPALYLAHDQITALSEMRHPITSSLRAANLILPNPPVVLYSIQVNLEHILDLTDSVVQKTLETTRTELTGPWAQQLKKGEPVPTHILANAAYATHRFQAIQYPSAEIVDGINLVVWTRKVRTPCFVEVYDPSERLAARVPKLRPTN